MAKSLITIKELVSEAQCYKTVKKLRWQEKVICLHSDSVEIIQRGYYDN
jgi:hypothetical protein